MIRKFPLTVYRGHKMHNSAMYNRNSHILLIDDKPEELRLLLILLRQSGYNISLATDAHAGYQKAVALCPDLIVLDIVMPRMDGFAMCRLLRESQATCWIPVIFLTSSNILQQKLKGFDVGGVDYILKPFSAEEALARINLHLHLSKNKGGTHFIPHLEGKSEVELKLTNDQIILNAAKNFIDENISDIPTLSDIAQAVGTYSKKLSMLFRQHVGITAFEYIRQVRVQKAKKLLAETPMSIQDIAQLTGFQSSCNFTTFFRRAMGIAPREFRKKPEAK
jgi:DNA-binding response OmpR family regulator